MSKLGFISILLKSQKKIAGMRMACALLFRDTWQRYCLTSSTATSSATLGYPATISATLKHFAPIDATIGHTATTCATLYRECDHRQLCHH